MKQKKKMQQTYICNKKQEQEEEKVHQENKCNKKTVSNAFLCFCINPFYLLYYNATMISGIVIAGWFQIEAKQFSQGLR